MKRFLIAIFALSTTLSSFGWGQKGHDVVAYIAECNLSPEVYQKVVKKLNNHSLVYYANWLDNASYTDQYRYTKSWHYANVDEGFTYDTMPKNEKGDVVTAINLCISEIKSGKLTADRCVLKRSTVYEHLNAERLYFLAKIDALKRGAICKCIGFNAFKKAVLSYNHIFERYVSPECRVSYMGYGIGNGNGVKRGATVEGVVINLRKTVLKGYRLKRAAV